MKDCDQVISIEYYAGIVNSVSSNSMKQYQENGRHAYIYY